MDSYKSFFFFSKESVEVMASKAFSSVVSAALALVAYAKSSSMAEVNPNFGPSEADL